MKRKIKMKRIKDKIHDLILEGLFYFASIMFFYAVMWYLFLSPHWIALAISLGCTVYIVMYIYANEFYKGEK